MSPDTNDHGENVPPRSAKVELERLIDDAMFAVAAVSNAINRERGKVPAFYTANQAWHRLDDARRQLNGRRARQP